MVLVFKARFKTRSWSKNSLQ